MNTVAVLSLIFAIMGFIVANLMAYKGFGSLGFWDIVIFGFLGAAAGALLSVLVMLVGVAIAF